MPDTLPHHQQLRQLAEGADRGDHVSDPKSNGFQPRRRVSPELRRECGALRRFQPRSATLTQPRLHVQVRLHQRVRNY